MTTTVFWQGIGIAYSGRVPPDWAIVDIRQLRYFIAIARAGSLTAASERLCASQPVLGCQVNKLEDRLDVDLFAANPARDKENELKPSLRAGPRYAGNLRWLLAHSSAKARRSSLPRAVLGRWSLSTICLGALEAGKRSPQ
jgi:hypothetical protein